MAEDKAITESIEKGLYPIVDIYWLNIMERNEKGQDLNFGWCVHSLQWELLHHENQKSYGYNSCYLFYL